MNNESTAPYQGNDLPAPETVPSPSGESTPKTGNDTVWHASKFGALDLRTATRNDVIETFGDPVWEGSVENEGEDGGNDKSRDNVRAHYVVMKFPLLSGRLGPFDVSIDPKTKMVVDILEFPAEPLSKPEIVRRFGEPIAEIDSNRSRCISKETAALAAKQVDKSIDTFLLYPNQGVYVLVRDGNEIVFVGYSPKCD